MKLSAVVYVHDSEETIAKCLSSLDFVDEIVVIDVESQDNSIKIAHKYTNKIYKVKNYGFVEPVRNEGINRATGDWILVLDADEEISISLKKEVRKLMEKDIDVWELPRKNMIFNTWIKGAGWWPDYQKRLFRKNHLHWTNKIHTIPKVIGSEDRITAKEDWSIVHYNYKSVEGYIARLNAYTTIEAKQTNKAQVNDNQLIKSFFDELNSRVFVKQSYKLGRIGLSLSILQAVYQFITELKIWELKGKNNNQPMTDEEFMRLMSLVASDMKYWIADYEYHKSKNVIKKIYWKCKRKLKL